MSEQEKFLQFHSKNPRVYERLVEYARGVAAKGFSQYSIKTIWAVLRWHCDMNINQTDSSRGFKLNDRYYSRYARLIMEQEPDLKNLFKTRVLRTV